jgi:hypothetical protein
VGAICRVSTGASTFETSAPASSDNNRHAGIVVRESTVFGEFGGSRLGVDREPACKARRIVLCVLKSCSRTADDSSARTRPMRRESEAGSRRVTDR